ncbi:glutamic acid-rich protein-like isoform X1 [Hibiscus syriacus]|uniref:glutamic acid-rich protein-like isoform X1 n=1 Tax=Hibiscus syriacus TaxID=106335 RepID=UPI001922EB2B|nr:glutamic acid-rich protein-like isoform X1 [Hibiscus syriacus]
MKLMEEQREFEEENEIKTLEGEEAEGEDETEVDGGEEEEEDGDDDEDEDDDDEGEDDEDDEVQVIHPSGGPPVQSVDEDEDDEDEDEDGEGDGDGDDDDNDDSDDDEESEEEVNRRIWEQNTLFEPLVEPKMKKKLVISNQKKTVRRTMTKKTKVPARLKLRRRGRDRTEMNPMTTVMTAERMMMRGRPSDRDDERTSEGCCHIGSISPPPPFSR